VLATQGSWRWPLAGLAAYGVAFALPFFMLAAAPGSLARIPRSGPWMDLLKRSLAVVEIALALKFLSNVDLVIGSGLLTRPVMIGLWGVGAIVLVALWGAYAHGARGTARGVALVGVGACALLGAWLAQGVRGHNLGELEAYLPPRVAGAMLRFPGASASPGSDLAWIMNDYSGALARGRSDGRPVLLDFTGYTCTNCRWMEANMFGRDEVAAQLRHFVRARLYTDGLGEPYMGQQRLQLETFGTVALPYYAVVTGDGSPVATFLGMTRDSREFIAFLQGARSRQPSRTP
jgi:thiol:disulfide interchange protein DsbD